jgi:hypothetical protein
MLAAFAREAAGWSTCRGGIVREETTMSTKRFKRLREDDAVWEIGNGLLDREQMLIYNEDPDLYMAQREGFDTTKEAFEFWDGHGAVVCGGTTKKGKPCRAVVAYAYDPHDFRRLQKEARRCHAHKGQPTAVRSAQIVPFKKAR